MKSTIHNKNNQYLHQPTIPTLILLILFLVTSCQAGSSSPTIPPTQPQTPTSQYDNKTPNPTATRIPEPFNGDRALEDVAYQLSLGPRTVGSSAHQEAGDWIIAQLSSAGWQVEEQDTSYQGKPVRNIIGKLDLSNKGEPWVIIGAHYDSRLMADRDPDIQKWNQPVPGANDGASGVAVLLELARTFPGLFQSEIQNKSTSSTLEKAGRLWLVFIDNEDNGNIPGWDWLMGSRAFVGSLKVKPDAVIIIDMIGDKNLDIKYEANSNPTISEEVWAQAAKLGYEQQFLAQLGFGIIDDHTAFLEAGIPAIDIIDFDYPYYHTTSDTIDKVSAYSLKVVGDTLIAWLINGSAIFGGSK